MSELTLKFKKPFYEAVYHLWDRVMTKDGRLVHNSEVQLRKVALGEDSDDDIFLSREPDGSRWFFKLNDMCEKFNQFKDAIIAYCQQDPILCDPEGYVMDGYARWFVCVKAGLIPKVEIAGGNLADDSAKVSWIRSRKLARHHLNEKQRMLIVEAEIRAHPERSENWTAELLGVSRTTVVKYREQMERAGTLKAVTKLVGKDGREYNHTPTPPLSPEQQSKDAAERQKHLDEAAWEKAQSKFADKVLHEGKIVSSLKNIRNFLKNTDPQKFEWYGEQIEAIRQALPESKVSTVSATRSAEWEVKTVEVVKTKRGATIKVDDMPDKLDVAEVKVGPVSVGGKTIKFDRAKALLLIPVRPKDATIEPPSEDDLMTEKGTVDPSSSVG